MKGKAALLVLLVVGAVGALLAILWLFGFGPFGPRGRDSGPSPDPALVARGREIFGDACAACHGFEANGRGPAGIGLHPPPADLVGKIVHERTDAEILDRIHEGKPGTAMPSFQAALSREDARAVVAYLRALADGAAPDARPR